MGPTDPAPNFSTRSNLDGFPSRFVLPDPPQEDKREKFPRKQNQSQRGGREEGRGQEEEKKEKGGSKLEMSSKKAADEEKKELFHVVHKVPAGDSPYVRAKHLQLVDKDPEAAIVWFWKAINTGDRVDSALKDMAIVMKQQDRAEEAVEAIKSFRHLCSRQAHESLDNVLIDLYKKCGRLEEQIELLKQKLRMICLGEAFNGKTTKTARSHGKKFQVSLKQETSRILGNLGWTYMQQSNYIAAEAVYRKAQTIEPDANKACNLALCLIKQSHFEEARSVLEDVGNRKMIMGSDELKMVNRANELLQEIKSHHLILPTSQNTEDGIIIERLEFLKNEAAPFRSRRLPIFEEISNLRDQMAC